MPHDIIYAGLIWLTLNLIYCTLQGIFSVSPISIDCEPIVAVRTMNTPVS